MALGPHRCRLAAVFAENVRANRLRLGLSQEQLAERASLHRTYIGMIERREKNVTIYSIERIARALRLDASTLLTERK
jgi:transcriptional regulator with XRE-family HTH domain